MLLKGGFDPEKDIEYVMLLGSTNNRKRVLIVQSMGSLPNGEPGRETKEAVTLGNQRMENVGYKVYLGWLLRVVWREGKSKLEDGAAVVAYRWRMFSIF